MNCAYCGECDLVILLVTSCSARKVHHRLISQYWKFKGILEFVGHQLVASYHDLFRATHSDENMVPIRLLLYSRVV